MEPLTPELLLTAYANGYFPMAERHDSPEIHWYFPEPRAILPLEAFHVPRSLDRIVRSGRFSVRLNTAFDEVIRACAQREETWINDEIIALYGELHRMGFAHSLECWQDGQLAGGLYGVALGQAFFGESMFTRRPNASRVALVHLVRWLKANGYTLLDTQFVNPHLVQFGVVEIPRDDYLRRLKEAVYGKDHFHWPSGLLDGNPLQG